MIGDPTMNLDMIQNNELGQGIRLMKPMRRDGGTMNRKTMKRTGRMINWANEPG